MDYSSLAHEMLKKCGMVRAKHCRADETLRQGAGKLMHTDGEVTKNASTRVYSMLAEKKSKYEDSGRKMESEA